MIQYTVHREIVINSSPRGGAIAYGGCGHAIIMIAALRNQDSADLACMLCYPTCR
jgi:hypothetical protein